MGHDLHAVSEIVHDDVIPCTGGHNVTLKWCRVIRLATAAAGWVSLIGIVDIHTCLGATPRRAELLHGRAT